MSFRGGLQSDEESFEGTDLAIMEYRRVIKPIGRPISRKEAMRIARQVLEKAERERIELAEREAERGLDWEGDRS